MLHIGVFFTPSLGVPPCQQFSALQDADCISSALNNTCPRSHFHTGNNATIIIHPQRHYRVGQRPLESTSPAAAPYRTVHFRSSIRYLCRMYSVLVILAELECTLVEAGLRRWAPPPYRLYHLVFMTHTCYLKILLSF
jgi:hypothetical protein